MIVVGLVSEATREIARRFERDENEHRPDRACAMRRALEFAPLR
jgi:hypothetical protein